ncbi:SMI1/KNR4 family protein [Streptomyces sp. SBT349]|uniref:SMI1/KNR4 family protein n=1 Tax=Streptomyces sp. SBT349 TaxID=1580539 RepID=UPI00066BBD72|nr:SMI1/KNR4 family protein [Streptomyces sp. SBT349]
MSQSTREDDGVWAGHGVRARVAELAADDPSFGRFGAARHRYRLGEPLAEAEVVAFEERQGVRLPESYRSFLTEVGDGGAGPYYGLFRLDGSDMESRDREERATSGFLTAPFPHTERWNPTDLSEDDYFHDRYVQGSLLIAEFGCGAFHRLVVTGPERGRVWFDDRGCDNGMSSQGAFEEWYLAWLDAYVEQPVRQPLGGRGQA